MSFDEILTPERVNALLQVEGCWRYQIGCIGDDEFCLVQRGDCWHVVYAERGQVLEKVFEGSEVEACELTG
jgi:hypothetical protein